MSYPIPKITYDVGSPPVTETLNFTLPPKGKPGVYPIADQEGVGTVTMTVSGLRQTMWWRTDTFYHLPMLMPWADMAAWETFIDFALQGNSFLYWPDASGTAYDEYWLEDLGGSARNTAGSQTGAWNPANEEQKHAKFELVLRLVPGGQHHT